ncbi:MAG: hypothetical protein Q9200_002505 [Gallowayella weberi]
MGSSSAEQWANAALLRSSWQRPEEQTAIRTMANLLRRQITPQIAATTIASSYEARMIRCISRLPNLLDENGNPIVRKTKAQMYWRDVPRFAYCFSETAIEHPFLEDLDRGLGLNRDSTIRSLLNSNIFGALYLLELDPDGSEYDYHYTRKLARDHLLFALEIATETPNQIRRAETFLPSAAM